MTGIVNEGRKEFPIVEDINGLVVFKILEKKEEDVLIYIINLVYLKNV